MFQASVGLMYVLKEKLLLYFAPYFTIKGPSCDCVGGTGTPGLKYFPFLRRVGTAA